MSPVHALEENTIEPLARLLGELGTGGEITDLLADLGIPDESGESTKWRRLHRIFLDVQCRDQSANLILRFIQAFVPPVRFAGKNEVFENFRTELNTILAFSGLHYEDDGTFRKLTAATTLTEAEHRADGLRAKFRGRRIHPEVLRYCKTELMQENYFHAVFEASKGLAQRIRDKSGVDGDGASLVDIVFSVNRPILAFNRLQTETENSEHKGFAALLKGCFAAVRNPLAHEPRILWEGEDDAADYFTLISLLHHKLDDCEPTGMRHGE